MAGTIQYRATGGVDFTFRFAWIAPQQTWRVYIEQQPSYGSRNSGAHASHRLGLPNAPFVCWTDPLRTYTEARAVAALWADATQHYIATGRFDAARDRRNVQDRSALGSHTEEQLRTALVEGPRPRTTNPIPPPSGRSGPIRRLLERIG